MRFCDFLLYDWQILDFEC